MVSQSPPNAFKKQSSKLETKRSQQEMYNVNDWEIKRCLRLSLAILLAAVGLAGLAALGFDVPILRQIVGFIFLTFVPGILILRILKIHNIGSIESLLYSVGLSIAFVMFTGAFANFVLPFIGSSKPISTFPIMTTLATFTLILAAVAYKRDKDFSTAPRKFNVSEIAHLPYLFLFLLPLLAILGAHLLNLYQNNFLLLFFIVVICCVVAMLAFDRLPRNAYPMAIVMIGISLLLHITLISSQLSGYDIHTEYYYQNLVAQGGYWDFNVAGDVNTALSVVFLNPIYSLLLNIDAIWVFKVLYPLLFCLMPLALFHIFRQQIGDKKAFLAAFFLMAMTTFFTEMTALARQQIAEVLFALLILLLIDRKLALNQRMTLAIIFTLSLIVSHYALAYICLYLLIVAWGIVALIRSRAGKRAWGWLTHKFGGLPQITSQGAFPHKIMAVIVSVYLIFVLAWYGSIGQGTALKTIRQIGEYSVTETGGFFESTEREALVLTAVGLDFPSASGWGKGFKFKTEYIALSTGAILILLACIVIPRFSIHLNVTRFYHISLFLLAPLCVVGGEVIWHRASSLAKSFSFGLQVKRKLGRLSLPSLSRAKRGDSKKQSHNAQNHYVNNVGGNNSTYLRFLALAILIPYFLFNSGFISEIRCPELHIPRDTPHSRALSSYRLDMPVFNQKEAEAVIYLAQIIDDDDLVYGDIYGRLLLRDRLFPQVELISDIEEVPQDAYIFLRTWNIEKQEINIVVQHGAQKTQEYVKLSNMPELLESRQLIYNNGWAQILR
jgi:uncharacterized membrane protein